MRRPALTATKCSLFFRTVPASLIAIALALFSVRGDALESGQWTDDPLPGSYRPGVVIVRFEEGRVPSTPTTNIRGGVFGDPTLDGSLLEHSVRKIERMLPPSPPMRTQAGKYLQRTFVVYYDGDADASELAESLRELDGVEFVSVDRYVEVIHFGETQSFPVDSYFEDQWNLHYPRDSVDIDMPEAWAIERGNSELVLGVLDLGTMVDTSGTTWKTYSDFKHFFTLEDNSPASTLSWSDINLDDSADSDFGGHEDNVFGVNFVPGYGSETNPYVTSFWENTPVNWFRAGAWNIVGYNLHGVHVAGIAIAKARFSSTPPSNIAGIANRCKLYMVSHLVSSTDVREAAAIKAAADFTSVINMSAGYATEPGPTSQIRLAVDYAINEKDVVFVAASGNYSVLGGGSQVPAPARWDGVLSVGAMDSTLTLNDDSVYGGIGLVDIVAPVDEGILASSHTECDPHPCAITEEVTNFAGTSAAAPQVAGIAMLVRSRFPALDQEETRERILRAAEFYWDEEDDEDIKKYGAGKANAFRALSEWGTLEENATWGSVTGMPDTIYVSGDLTIPDGVTLTIRTGAVILVAPDDILASGVDDGRIEINVDGELVVHGSVADPVIIEAWDPQGTSDWVGIYVSEGSGGASFQNCIIRNADIAIDSYEPVSLRNVTIEDVSEAAVSMWGAMLTVDVSRLGPSDGDCIRLDDSAATIDSTDIEGYAGYGLYSTGNVATNVSNCTFQDGDVGIYVENNSTNGTILETLFDDNDIGISYYSSTRPTIDECTITANTHGIYLDHYSSPPIQRCIDSASYNGDITGNGSGISCFDNSDPSVGNCNISSNGTGVGVFDDSEPDLDGNGANKFMSNSSYHVANLVTGTTVPATVSYWYQNTGSPNYYPNAAKILGSVDYTGALGSGPNPVSPRPDPRPEAEVVVTGLGRAHPNPFNPTVQIPYSVAGAGAVRIDIFDVQGRLVRTLVDERKERGNHVVVWDGTRASGSPTASAVYFVRMRTGRFNETQKIVLLK